MCRGRLAGHMDLAVDVTPSGIEWFRERGETPAIVSVSDVHGYLEAARNALTAVGDTDAFPPLVTSDDDGRLHWAGNDYVLVINGDLIDRGDRNRECLALVERLAAEAPDGRVRYHLGNHEMAALFPDRFRWPGVYSVEMDDDVRGSFLEHVADGRIAVGFDGYEYAYSHAGANDSFDTKAVNGRARDAGRRLVEMWRDGRYETSHLDVLPEYQRIFGVGGEFGRGPSAGLLWMDFKHMEPDAPPQVVGHSRHQRPTRTGNVVCENVIRDNLGLPGGEAVLIERPDGVVAVTKTSDGATVTEV